jgi:hypothetical protein
MNNPQSVFKIAFAIVMLKFLFGGTTILGLPIPPMSGSEFAMALAAVGGIHSVSRHVDNLAAAKKDDA